MSKLIRSGGGDKPADGPCGSIAALRFGSDADRLPLCQIKNTCSPEK